MIYYYVINDYTYINSTIDPSLPTYIRIPKPIPSTWAHRIVTLEEYEKPVPEICRYVNRVQ
jgi:hypothetical protein